MVVSFLQTARSQPSCLVGYQARFGVRPRRNHAAFRKLSAPQNGAKWRASQWLENSAQTDVDVPLEEAWALWEDRSRIPEWMAWITSVVVMDDPKLSKWTLSTYQFNRQVPNQLINLSRSKLPLDGRIKTNFVAVVVNNFFFLFFFGPPFSPVTAVGI